MRLKSYILFIILTFTLTSCSQILSIAVFVKIFGLDSNSKKLEIGFDFKRFVGNQDVLVTRIKIYKNDSLLYELESETQAITNWKFPQIPTGFRIKYPTNTNSISEFQKSDKLRFEFAGTGEYAAYGSWRYEPKFSTSKYRWLFDEDGNKKIGIDCYYEPWVGKDIIKVVSSNDFQVDNESFQLYDKSNKAVEFQVKTKREFTNRIALVLKRDLKKGETLFLSFRVQKDKIYEEEIIVPDKSIIGLAGKFNDL